MADVFDNQPVVWRPQPQAVAASRLGQFCRRYGIAGLKELGRRAAEDPRWFWGAVLEDIGWPLTTPYDEVLDVSQGWQWATWFVGATTNVALAALDRHVASGRGQHVAVIEEREDGQVRRWRYGELQEAADRLARGLESRGIGTGDVVGVYLPMIGETVVTMMALAKLGAIFLPIFSGYGASAMAARLADAGAKAVVTADGFTRRGKVVPMKEVADEAVAAVPSVGHLIMVSHLTRPVPWHPERDIRWDEVLAAPGTVYATKSVPAETPLMIIYTSGTTGKPKGAVHTHLGFPLKATQDLWHCFDLQASDTLFWYTDMGWMMGPWMVYGGLITGATILLYDGTPDYPHPGRLWEVIDRHQVSIFGISPTAVRSLMAYGQTPLEGHSLASLRVLGSSGEPWNPDPWHWFFQEVGHGRCPIINYSGGTEISGGIVSAFFTEPQKPCAFNGPIPGIPAAVLDDNARPVSQEVGELAILGPWPGMTRGFWHDRERYLDAYWRRFPDVWVHGDFAYIDEEGFWYILGRSDDTIKVAGKRVGPAEVESVLVSHPLVVEAAAVGIPHPVKGETIVGFVVAPQAGIDLETELLERVADQLGKALRPQRIHRVPELPKTRNGKVVRRALKARYLGQSPGDLSSVENPGALEYLDGLREEGDHV